MINNLEQSIPEPAAESNEDSIPVGVSMENTSYIESNSDNSSLTEDEGKSFDIEQSNKEEHTPQLFSNENESEVESDLDEISDTHTEELFDQDSHEDEDFEIPAFLRKQKF